ncbi:MAG: pyridoxal-phosphate dependent enzyme [Chitinophagaceae bacterium]|nr:MAG: pyridoxal-phosphate dependent enzyme [Chitinophagaceae bacterium]
MPSVGPRFLQPFAPDPRLDELPSLYVPDIPVSVLRLDETDQLVSGNKWYKLRYYLDDAMATGRKIVTWGGAWSNHILAAAVACQRAGVACTGIIRGEEPATPSFTLTTAREAGMELLFISREEYGKKIPPRLFPPDEYLEIPEGGYGETGAKGASTILDVGGLESFHHIFCAVGTGTMLAGLVNRASHQQVTGIPVLKNKQAGEEVTALLQPGNNNWQLVPGYEFGGYARYNQELIDFMNSFYQLTGIPSDFVYTGKLFYAATDLLRKGMVEQGEKVLLVHSGGLQGNRGLPSKTLIF